MADPVLSGNIDKALSVALNGLAARQRAISNNLANVDTPGFKASEVRFEDQLQNAIARDRRQSPTRPLARPASSDPGHFVIEATEAASVESVQPQVVRDEGRALRFDGNNVDIDKEMVELAEATIAYNSLVQLVAARVSMARYAVNEGRR